MAKALKFVCPDCENEVLEKGLYPCSAGEVVIIDSDGKCVVTGETTLYDTETEFFRCKKCGYQIMDGDDYITDESDLVEWLKALPCNQQSTAASAPQAYATLYKISKAVADLHHVLTDTIEGGRLSESDLPDDFLAITHHLEICSHANQEVRRLLESKEWVIAKNALDIYQALKTMCELYGPLHDALSCAVEDGTFDIKRNPQAKQQIIDLLADCCGADDTASTVIKKIEGKA